MSIKHANLYEKYKEKTIELKNTKAQIKQQKV